MLGLAMLTPLLLHPSAAEPTVLKRAALEVSARLLALLLILHALWNRRLEFARSPVTPAAVALLASGMLSTALSRYRYAGWEVLLVQTYLVIVYLAAIWILRTPRQLSRLVSCFAASACLVSVYGILQSFGVDFMKYSEPGERVFASQGNATVLAGYLILLLPLFVNMASASAGDKGAQNPRPVSLNFFMAAASGLCVWCLYLTYSRAAAAGLLVALAVNYLLLAKYEGASSRRLSRAAGALAGLAIISLVMWIALPAAEKDRLLNTFNLQHYWATRRIWLWKAGLHTAEEHLLVGTGPGTYQIYSRSLPWNLMTHPEWKQFPGTFHAHNEFIETASDQGIVGLACFTWVLAAFAFSGLRALHRVSDPVGRRLIAGATAGVTAFLFQNLFGVTMRFVGASVFFWLMLAVPALTQRAYCAETGTERCLTSPRVASPWRWTVTAVLVIAWFASLPGAVKPMQAQFCLLRARGFMEEKAWNEAARELQAAVVMQPNSVQLRDTLAQVYASMGNERLKDALREFQTAAKLNPDYRQVQYNIGVAYSRLGKHREALRAFTRAARLQNAPWEYAGMACSYLALKRMDEARWAARKAASLDPDNPEYRRLLEQLGEDTGPLSVPARP